MHNIKERIHRKLDIAKIHNNDKKIHRSIDSVFRFSHLLQAVNDGSCEFIGCCVATKILCLGLAGFQHMVNGTVDLLAVVSQVDVAQHFRGAKQHCSWVGNVLA